MKILTKEGNIDWKMFGLALTNFEREKDTDAAGMARALNAHAKRELFKENDIERMKKGSLVPNVEQLETLAKVVKVNGRMSDYIADIVNGLLNPPSTVAQSVVSNVAVAE